mgnify:CR=1 FL=1|jgi:hypothetical protein|tara:strand:+ start:1601 stop:1747 length:147 start_codon:yes stop_codon:yes gene_type:complete
MITIFSIKEIIDATHNILNTANVSEDTALLEATYVKMKPKKNMTINYK